MTADLFTEKDKYHLLTVGTPKELKSHCHITLIRLRVDSQITCDDGWVKDVSHNRVTVCVSRKNLAR